MNTVEAASKPEPHWFYKTVGSGKEFSEYFASVYSYEKLLRIHPVELRDICEEALEFAKYFRIKLPDYVENMAKDPMAFSQQALEQDIIPDFSEITKINREQGTDYRNMLEYLETFNQYLKPIPESAEEPFDATASANKSDESDESDEEALASIDDIDNYVSGLTES